VGLGSITIFIVLGVKADLLASLPSFKTSYSVATSEKR
jgi:hypothetical protein